MDSARLSAWLTLARASGVGSVAVQRLLSEFGTPEAALKASPTAWRALGLSSLQIDALGKPDRDGIAQDLRWLDGGERRGLLTVDDPRYPARLREIAHAPPLLFCIGDADLLAWPQLAIVGSRSATPQGLDNAQAFAAELARRGFTITSGLALGIDGAAHRGALQAQGHTVAVCATGLDRVYPARHQALAREIAVQGLLLSEFPVGVQALAENFPRRNRIIAGLSLGVLVVEAARESGSLITARLALEQGREVFAIPGSIHNPQARGCHQLIRQGAKLVETVDDLFEELGPLLRPFLGTRLATKTGDNPAAAVVSPPADTAEARVLAALDDAPLDLDALVARSGLSVAEVQTALTTLELDEQLAMAPGGRYQRRHG